MTASESISTFCLKLLLWDNAMLKLFNSFSKSQKLFTQSQNKEMPATDTKTDKRFFRLS